MRFVAQAILKKVWNAPDVLRTALHAAMEPIRIQEGFDWNIAVDAMVTWAVEQYIT